MNFVEVSIKTLLTALKNSLLPSIEYINMKNIYLHIGAHKTGTTAIQNFLLSLQNNNILQKQGISYTFLSDNLHTLTNNSKNQKEFCAIFTQKIAEFIANAPFHTFIFSSEGLSSIQILDHKEIIAALAEAFSPYNVKILYYIRRQDKAFESMWAQRLKHFLSPLEVTPPPSILKEILETYTHYFSKESINVRVYDKNKLVNNDIVCDFFEWIGLENFLLEHKNSAPSLEISENTQNTLSQNQLNNFQNHSLSPSQLRITLSYLRQNRLSKERQILKTQALEAKVVEQKEANRELTPKSLWEMHADFLMIANGVDSDIRFAEDLLSLYALPKENEPITHNYMSLEKRQQFLEECREDNDFIAREYLGKKDGELFDLHMPKEVISLDSPSTDDIVKSFLPMLVHFKQSIDTLTKVNLALQSRIEALESTQQTNQNCSQAHKDTTQKNIEQPPKKEPVDKKEQADNTKQTDKKPAPIRVNIGKHNFRDHS